VNFNDPNFVKDMENKIDGNYEEIKSLLLNLALCHTIIPEIKNNKIFYNASSPDELALVNAARSFDCSFVGRDEDNNILINFQGRESKYKLMNILEFNSARKRMSAIVETPEG
jgi:magnesium-transporting ATPase (P-type)